MSERRRWSRAELLVAFRLYCRTPFGRLHQHNPEIIDLGQRLGRTTSAVAMKACNFASLDPAQQARGIRALGSGRCGCSHLCGSILSNGKTLPHPSD